MTEGTDTQAETERLRAALAYYAAQSTWWLSQTERGRVIPAEDDRGARARAALSLPVSGQPRGGKP